MCKYYFGRFGQWSSLLFSMISLIGAMVVYWVLMSNFLFNTGKFIYSKQPLCYATSLNSLILDCGLYNDLMCSEVKVLFFLPPDHVHHVNMSDSEFGTNGTERG